MRRPRLPTGTPLLQRRQMQWCVRTGCYGLGYYGDGVDGGVARGQSVVGDMGRERRWGNGDYRFRYYRKRYANLVTEGYSRGRRKKKSNREGG